MNNVNSFDNIDLNPPKISRYKCILRDCDTFELIREIIVQGYTAEEVLDQVKRYNYEGVKRGKEQWLVGLLDDLML